MSPSPSLIEETQPGPEKDNFPPNVGQSWATAASKGVKIKTGHFIFIIQNIVLALHTYLLNFQKLPLKSATSQ